MQHHGYECGAARPDTDPTNLHVPLSCTLCLRPSPLLSVSQQGDEAPTLPEVVEDANRRLERDFPPEELARAMEISDTAEGGGSVEVAEVLKVTQTEEDGTTNLPTDGEAEEDADHGPDAEKMHPDCKQLPEAKNEPEEEELEVSSHDPSSPVLYSDPAIPAPSSPLVVQSVRGISCSRETNLTRLRLPCGVWRVAAAGA